MKNMKLDKFLREITESEKMIYQLHSNPVCVSAWKDFILNFNLSQDKHAKNILFDINEQKFDITKDELAKIIFDLQKIQRIIDSIFVGEKIRLMKHLPLISTPIHYHSNFIEICYIYDGEITQIINNKEIILKKGSFLILGANIPHSIKKATKNDIMINCLIGKESINDNFLSLLRISPAIYQFFLSFICQTNPLNEFFIISAENDLEVCESFNQLLNEYFLKENPNESIIECYLIIILIRLFSINDKNIYNYVNMNSKDFNSVEVISFINKNIKNISLDIVAKQFGYNSNYFSQIFKKNIGKNFQNVVKEIRIEQAAQLLNNTNLNIRDVGLVVGYKNTSFFYRSFLEYYNMTPHQFREVITN